MRISKSVILFFTIEIAITVICILIYLAVQQSYRNGANEPQIQIAEKIKYELNYEKNDSAIFPGGNHEISQMTLSPFVILYNGNKEPVASDALLNGIIPRIPDGVLESSRNKEMHFITWQPEADKRFALVIIHSEGKFDGYIVCGRSLKIAEEHIQNLILIIFAGWLIASIATGAMTFLFSKAK